MQNLIYFNHMIELEKTYLAKYLPEDLENFPSKEIIDIYIPPNEKIRIRKHGDKYELTKKLPVGDDYSIQREQTIELTEEEWKWLSKLEGRKTIKKRYDYQYQGRKAEIDVFEKNLAGLVVIDFEFETEEELKSFEMPDFCLADLSQERWMAGGMLAGKSYTDIEKELEKYGYKKL